MSVLATATGIVRDLGVPLPGRGHYDVRGKVVLITGGGDGIGLALARELHGRGAVVALTDIDPAALARAGTELGSRVHTFVADVRDRVAMEAVVRALSTETGGLDVVVANAGVTPPPATLRQIDPEGFDRVLDINLTGVFNTVRPAIDEVVARRGHIVVVSSAAAFAPGLGGASYMISKAGVEQLGRALRLELAGFGASAGVAYFGVVDTRLAKATLDDDALGAELEARLPRPLRRRITAEQAAEVLAGAIARRAGRTLAPAAWQGWALLRGFVNVVADGVLAADRRCHTLIRELEARGSRP
ncbi:short-chain dehydrogenase/reductase [Amycolatopsis magusensis]|uniref:NAD(P)-dependent dehydrogenase (Short-subunit alcohol dehydrogenase family) n=1 Tax=Amycolatopsis magusensis TaxID=882444 RepID=A0ABS4PYU3_9PSEU|nr:short-chain dehydrogenase/reductase [Amycolatopsis magusensis]MBP2184596.1 NAD(P)-dependent dehydrogenase (short-subunit alcohol dehydrogenase family) [Amycolatopsis magusensis]